MVEFGQARSNGPWVDVHESHLKRTTLASVGAKSSKTPITIKLGSAAFCRRVIDPEKTDTSLKLLSHDKKH
jgi:hypothetical protein